MKNFTSKSLVIQRENGTCVRIPPEVVGPTVEYREATVRGTLNGIEVYAPSGRKVNFGSIKFDRKDAPFIVTKEVFDALPDSAIEFVTVDPTSIRYHTVYGDKREAVVHRLISKSDLDIIPFVESQ